MDPLWLAALCIALLLIFDFTNGFHDTANMVGSAVATQAMTPVQAILVVSVFTLLGPLLGGTAVADTLGEFIQLDDLPELDGVAVILSATLGAIGWNLVTWRRGLPSSSSHALVSGLVGAVLVETDSQHVVWGWNTLWETGEWSGVTKIVAALLLSPLVGLLFGFLLLRLLRLLLRAARPTVNRSLRRWEWLGAAGLAFSHGTNDAQKSMGDHHPGTAAGRTDRPVPGSRLGHPCLRTEHYPRHLHGRVAHRAHGRLRHLPPAPRARTGQPDDGSRGHIRDRDVRRAGLHHARGKFQHHGGGCRRAAQGGPLGQGGRDPVHLAGHPALRRAGRGSGTVDHEIQPMNEHQENALIRLWHRIFPQVPDFHGLIQEQAVCLVESVRALQAYLGNPQQAKTHAIRDCIERGHQLRRRNEEQLLRSFITPIDREDIANMIVRVDHVFDYIEAALRETETLGLQGDQWMQSMLVQLANGSQELSDGIDRFKQAPGLAAAPAAAIREAERHVEKIYQQALGDMHKGSGHEHLLAEIEGGDLRHCAEALICLMKRREVYRHLSNAADRLAHAGAQLHDMSVKYG